MLLSTAYFPPISYFALLARAEGTVWLDGSSYYVKQSWRNRCRILTASGPGYLNVPVVHGEDLFHTPVSGVRVDYSTPWLPKTQRAIATSYEGSPFFLYYRDALWELLERRPETLWELTLGIIRFFCAKIGIAPRLEPLKTFVPEGAMDGDYREILHPKRPDTVLRDLGLERPYWQVFRDRLGFVPGLSVMDLLFNEGPESLCFLK